MTKPNASNRKCLPKAARARKSGRGLLPGRTVLCVIACLGGCDLGQHPENTQRTDAAYGQRLFAKNCAACHGRDAKGGGAASLGLGVVPPDLTRFTRLNGGTFPRNRVMSAIDGFDRKDHWKNPMPVFGDENLGTLVQVEDDGISTPIPADLLALAHYLEAIQN